MRPLSETLRSAQQSDAVIPAVKVALTNHAPGGLRLDWQRLYSGSEPAGPHGATMLADGALFRCRVTPPAPAGLAAPAHYRSRPLLGFQPVDKHRQDRRACRGLLYSRQRGLPLLDRFIAQDTTPEKHGRRHQLEHAGNTRLFAHDCRLRARRRL